MTKNPRLSVAAVPNPPLRAMIPSGTPITFQARAVGYRMTSFEITLPTGTQVERVFELEPQAIALDTVRVAAAPSTNWRSVDAFEKAQPFLNPPPGLVDSHGQISFPFGFYVNADSGLMGFFRGH